uniref:Queuosine 5'-phosphate N-glycosylase/hydrolase n=1 Tax=Macrostomum lignano TaxID=282301 RepID=A0A1I8F9N7_9PLAT
MPLVHQKQVGLRFCRGHWTVCRPAGAAERRHRSCVDENAAADWRRCTDRSPGRCTACRQIAVTCSSVTATAWPLVDAQFDILRRRLLAAAVAPAETGGASLPVTAPDEVSHEPLRTDGRVAPPRWRCRRRRRRRHQHLGHIGDSDGDSWSVRGRRPPGTAPCCWSVRAASSGSSIVTSTCPDASRAAIRCSPDSCRAPGPPCLDLAVASGPFDAASLFGAASRLCAGGRERRARSATVRDGLAPGAVVWARRSGAGIGGQILPTAGVQLLTASPTLAAEEVSGGGGGGATEGGSGDRLGRLAGHLLSQCSMYPLLPSHRLPAVGLSSPNSLAAVSFNPGRLSRGTYGRVRLDRTVSWWRPRFCELWKLLILEGTRAVPSYACAGSQQCRAARLSFEERIQKFAHLSLRLNLAACLTWGGSGLLQSPLVGVARRSAQPNPRLPAAAQLRVGSLASGWLPGASRSRRSQGLATQNRRWPSVRTLGGTLSLTLPFRSPIKLGPESLRDWHERPLPAAVRLRQHTCRSDSQDSVGIDSKFFLQQPMSLPQPETSPVENRQADGSRPMSASASGSRRAEGSAAERLLPVARSRMVAPTASGWLRRSSLGDSQRRRRRHLSAISMTICRSKCADCRPLQRWRGDQPGGFGDRPPNDIDGGLNGRRGRRQPSSGENGRRAVRLAKTRMTTTSCARAATIFQDGDGGGLRLRECRPLEESAVEASGDFGSAAGGVVARHRWVRPRTSQQALQRPAAISEFLRVWASDCSDCGRLLQQLKSAVKLEMFAASESGWTRPHREHSLAQLKPCRRGDREEPAMWPRKAASWIPVFERGEYSLGQLARHPLNPKSADGRAVSWVFLADTLNFSFWSDAECRDLCQGQVYCVSARPQYNRCAIARLTPSFASRTRASGTRATGPCCAAINRTLDEGFDLLDPKTLARPDSGQIDSSASRDRSEMPLMQERLDCLQETGRILVDRYGGDFKQCAAAAAAGSARRLLELVVTEFPCYRDVSVY